MDTNEAKEVVHKAKNVADALSAQEEEKAANLLDKAEMVADALLKGAKQSDERITKSLSDALRDIFGENVNSGRFIATNRIPLLCQSVLGIEKSLVEINEKLDKKYVTKDSFFPVKLLVYGFAGTLLTGLVVMLFLNMK